MSLRTFQPWTFQNTYLGIWGCRFHGWKLHSWNNLDLMTLTSTYLYFFLILLKMTQSCLGKLTIWYFVARLWFQSCAVFMQYFYLLPFVLISSKKLFSFVFQRIDTYQYNFLLRFLNLNLRACWQLEWVKSWFFPLQSWKYGEDQS